MLRTFHSAAKAGRACFHIGSSFRSIPHCLFAGLALSALIALNPPKSFSQAKARSDSTQSPPSQLAYRDGVAWVRQGHLDEAIRAFDSGLQSNPRDVKLLDAAGAARSFRGDLEGAKKRFLAALEVDPNFGPARKNLAITYFALGQYDLAAAEFSKLSASHAAPVPVIDLFLGMIAEKKGDDAKALLLLRGAGPVRDQYPEALLSLASAALRLKRSHEAAAALHTLDHASNLTAEQSFKAGELYSQLGDDRGALAAFERAGAKDAGLAKVDYQRAVLLDRLERPKEALALLKESTAGNPDSDSLNLLAHVAEKTGDLDVAIQSLRQAAKLNPLQEENYLDFSTMCADYGNYALALEGAEVGLDHLPNSYRLLVQKGVVLQSLGRLEESQEALKRASTLQADNSVALLSLAIVEADSGQWGNAENTLSAAIHSFPGNYYMRYELGKVLIHLDEGNQPDVGRKAKAELAFRKAIGLNPSFPDAYYQLAKLLLRDSPAEAEQNLTKCLRLDPNHAPAQYTLARLYVTTGRRAAGQALIDRFESQQQAAKLKEQKKPRIEAVER